MPSRVDPELVTVSVGGQWAAKDRSRRWGNVSLGAGRWIWTPLTVKFDDPERDVIAELVVVTGENGRPRAWRVEVVAREDDGEVAPESHRIPVTEIVRVAVRKAASIGPDVEPGKLQSYDEVVQWPSDGKEVAIPRRGWTARTDERLRRVAEIYQDAPRGRRREAVRDQLDLHSINTARNLIAAARKGGFFDEAKADGVDVEEGTTPRRADAPDEVATPEEAAEIMRRVFEKARRETTEKGKKP